MEKSDHYYLRRERMKNLQVPTISEVIEELGDDLAETLFQECPDPLKLDLGLTPLLKGAGDDLWISPSDILIEKVCLKPPLTNKHMKALTHQGILMIGRDVERKFYNETELEKKRALAELEEMLLFMAGLEKRQAVEAARKEERQRCEAEKEQMRIEFEARLQYELEQLENRLREEYEALMKLQKGKLDNEWQEKLEAAVEETVAKLTEQFLQDLAEQEKELLRKFAIEIKKEQIKRKMDIQEIQDCCRETFLQLKHQLECKNIANMMYILCTERRKCQSERKSMEEDYQRQVLDLQAVVTEKEVEITRLTRELEHKVKQMNLREECLLEILRQFQKFINFALRSSPTQAEFLLSVEKMMMFELAEAITHTDKRHAKRLARTLFPWKTESESTSTNVSYKESLKSLLPHDYHQCYNEIEPPLSDHSLTSADYLPAFHYDKHMYVREDFRNMMSKGIEISPSNLIWNRDVEHLMQILRRSVTSIKQKEEIVEEEEKEAAVEEEEKETIKQGEMQEKSDSEVERHPMDAPASEYTKSSRKSVVYFRRSAGDGELLFPVFESFSGSELSPTQSELYNEMAVPVRRSSDDINMVLGKECCKVCYLPQVMKQEPPLPLFGTKSSLPLIGARNSLELRKDSDKRNFSRLTTQDMFISSGAGILCAQDSLHKHRMSIKPTTKKSLTSRENLKFANVIALHKKEKRSNTQSATPEVSKDSEQTSDTLSRSSVQRPSKDLKKLPLKEEQPLDVESRASVQTHSKDPKKLLRPSVLKGSKDSVKRPHVDEDQNNVYRISKLSLSRDSYLVHKHSLIFKQHPKLSEESLRDSTTLKLKKPVKSPPDAPERTALKKSSRYQSLAETRSTLSRHSSITQYSRDLPIPTSKLTMSRDSLDLLRSNSKISELSRTKRKYESKDSIEIKDGILSLYQQSEQISPSPIIKLDDGSRTVKMSHIEVLPFEDVLLLGPKVFEEQSNCSEFVTEGLTTIDSPWLVYHDEEPIIEEIKKPPQPVRDNFLTKPNVAQVMGDHTAKEHMQKDTEFTLHRASSLLSIFRKHPSLIKIFTPCTK